ncbi:MAG: hypothetical protein HY301_01735 [Verrucomicrobia bacterium]|nr:hypothetical protein [Planctomycetota bacterium]MBI3878771.1 hypothetical protein [Verrucomicrobiota bacterium]
MSKVHTRQIVIDADIARAAGDTPDVSGVAKSCRDFLRAVLDICHQAVWTPDIAAEWKRHASRYARKWRVQMAARKKLKETEALPVAGLESRVLASNDPGLLPEKITKDLHLVFAAVATESPVASHDGAIRRRLVNSLGKVPELNSVIWVDPANSDETPLDWLRAGAPSDKHRELGYNVS